MTERVRGRRMEKGRDRGRGWWVLRKWLCLGRRQGWLRVPWDRWERGKRECGQVCRISLWRLVCEWVGRRRELGRMKGLFLTVKIRIKLKLKLKLNGHRHTCHKSL